MISLNSNSLDYKIGILVF